MAARTFFISISLPQEQAASFKEADSMLDLQYLKSEIEGMKIEVRNFQEILKNHVTHSWISSQGVLPKETDRGNWSLQQEVHRVEL